MPEHLSLREARSIALRAQGFLDRRPSGAVRFSHLQRVLDRVQLVQLDAVNVVARTHYMPFFSRLGPYDRSLIDHEAFRRRAVFEYWAHEASIVPMDQHPLFSHRMAGERHTHGGLGVERDHPGFIASVLEEVRARGPLRSADLEDAGPRTGPWWGYGKGKVALEYHFALGNVTTHSRRNFSRLYDLAERVIPPAILSAPALPAADAHREMVRRSASALGVATTADLADYYRMKRAEAAAAVPALLDEGTLLPATVEGWAQPAFLHRDARIARRPSARAILSMFDSLVWDRARTERLFNFHYRIEIYTPAAKRRFGYYVMPFLLGDSLVGRLDLKADRQAGVLAVRGAFAEASTSLADVAPAAAAELKLMAAWLGLEGVQVEMNGELAPALAAEVAALY